MTRAPLVPPAASLLERVVRSLRQRVCTLILNGTGPFPLRHCEPSLRFGALQSDAWDATRSDYTLDGGAAAVASPLASPLSVSTTESPLRTGEDCDFAFEDDEILFVGSPPRDLHRECARLPPEAFAAVSGLYAQLAQVLRPDLLPRPDCGLLSLRLPAYLDLEQVARHLVDTGVPCRRAPPVAFEVSATCEGDRGEAAALAALRRGSAVCLVWQHAGYESRLARLPGGQLVRVLRAQRAHLEWKIGLVIVGYAGGLFYGRVCESAGSQGHLVAVPAERLAGVQHYHWSLQVLFPDPPQEEGGDADGVD